MGKFTIRETTLGVHDSKQPVNVNPVVDPLAAETDPLNVDYEPQSAAELQSTIKNLVQGSRLSPQDAYVKIKQALEKGEENMKQEQLETVIRKQIKKILSEKKIKDLMWFQKDFYKKAAKEMGIESSEDTEITPDMEKLAGEIASSSEKKSSKVSGDIRGAAKVPTGLEPTKIPTGTSGRGPSKYTTQLKDLLGKMQDDENDSSSDVEKSSDVDENIKLIEKATKEDAARFMDVLDDARDFFVEYFESDEGDEVSPSEQEDLLKNVTETKTFRDMFKEEFGVSYRDYVLKLGDAVKEVIASGKNFSIVKDVGGEDVVGVKDIALGLGVSAGQVMNIENEALAKWVLETAAGLE